jgi:hypothetical protein
MLRFFTSPTQFTSGREFSSLNRREWLRIGGLGALGLLAHSDPAVAAAASRVPGFGKAKSVILVYASGGQSQLETWDPKPEAPEGIRGEFGAIQTSVPGTFLSEHMPRLARLADRYTIVRSVSHDDLDHGSATYLTLTGRFHPRKSSNPPPRSTDDPSCGAVLQRVRPSLRFPYTAVSVNGPALVPELPAPGQDGGFLGRSYEPLLLGDVSSSPIAVPCLDPLPEVNSGRLAARHSLKTLVDSASSNMEHDRTLLEMDGLYRQAFELLSSPACRKAFDLSEESPAMRDRYGRHRSGQACLLARRLVEAHVPLVTVIFNHTNRGQDHETATTDAYGWDTHNDIFEAMKVHLLPRFDATFSTLLEDLDERGLLDETLVICMGEFGRAPRIALEANFAGRTPGRKHWASVYSIVLAGAGVQRGAVYGASDKIAAVPARDPVSPPDIAATMFSALGIDPRAHYQDSLGRPFAIATGRPIAGIYG